MSDTKQLLNLPMAEKARYEENKVKYEAEKKAMEMLAPLMMQKHNYKSASQALLAIYNPQTMPENIHQACSELLIWCAAQANYKGSAA